MDDKVTYTMNCDACGEVFYGTEAFPSPQLCTKCKRVEELVEWVAKRVAILRGLSMWEYLPDKQTKNCGWACKEVCIREAKQILSNPDYPLALIVREKLNCWYCGGKVVMSIVHDCGYSVSGLLPVIPLARELKEDTNGTED